MTDSEMITLWRDNQNWTSSALLVRVKKETEKAIQFSVVDNEKMSFWLPKKAIKFQDGMAVMARWCTPGEWYWKAENRYASHYRR